VKVNLGKFAGGLKRRDSDVVRRLLRRKSPVADRFEQQLEFM
jgi:hypothetical protein